MVVVLRRDPDTGRQNVIVKLGPDDAHRDHEQLHRALVEKLMSRGLKPEDLGEVTVEREGMAPG